MSQIGTQIEITEVRPVPLPEEAPAWAPDEDAPAVETPELVPA